MDSTLLTEALKEKIKAIEGRLGRSVPARIGAGWIRGQTGRSVRDVDPLLWQRLTAPARELLDRGGKRWRPLLLLLCAEIAGDWKRSLSLVPLVELAHNGSLIVDDIEDGSPQRRGAEALHLQFGLDLALNAGNLMYFLSARVIEQAPLSDQEKLQVYRFFVEDMIRLHLGQGLDILWHRDHENIPSQAEYLRMCRLKTGALARLAARAGVIAGGGGLELAERLGDIAEDFGAGFQIIDDVKNLSTGVPGKQRGDDIIEGKKSLPVILYLEQHPHRKASVRDLFQAAGSSDSRTAVQAIEQLIAELEPSGCLQEAESRAFGLLQETRKRLERGTPPSAARSQLLQLVDLLITG